MAWMLEQSGAELNNLADFTAPFLESFDLSPTTCVATVNLHGRCWIFCMCQRYHWQIGTSNKQQPSQWKSWQHFKFSTTVNQNKYSENCVFQHCKFSTTVSTLSSSYHISSLFCKLFCFISIHLLANLLSKVLKTFCLFYTLGVFTDKTNLVV
jgi:hypothetical protein